MNQPEMSGSNAVSSSDFVKKLYKMLEDKAHQDVVRWGDEGSSFVVLENDVFTKSILPKNFKHSNFASFVRQLNKYDFHKVRHNNENDSPYGHGAWEFKHPDFKADNKDALDNIRRKAPVPKKAASASEENPAAFPHIDLIQTQLAGTQTQLQQLQDKYDDLSNNHVLLMQHVLSLQRFMKAYNMIFHQVIDQERRNSRALPFTNGNQGGMGIADIVASGQEDDPNSPLQQASNILKEFNAEILTTQELEQRMTFNTFVERYSASTPPEMSNPGTIAPTPTTANTHLGYPIAHPHHHDPMENLVYPMGHTNGIDPIDSQHIHNIPYGIPVTNGDSDMILNNGNGFGPSDDGRRKRPFLDPEWGPRKPKVLLVEDDITCSRIGRKFLDSFSCNIQVAYNGIEACQIIEKDQNFDLILMDIIMPLLDGISAASTIRTVIHATHIPIIAMTSNIRAEDIDMYFRYGMSDVLPKPFTRLGMFKTLTKHLGHLRKTPLSSTDLPQASVPSSQINFGASGGSIAPQNLSMSHVPSSLKDETSPGKSPGSSNWSSPAHVGASPQSVGYGAPVSISTGGQIAVAPMGGGGHMGTVGYNLTPTHPQFPNGGAMPGLGPNPGMGHRRVMSDMDGAMNGHDGGDMKRQRMYPPQGGFAG